MNSKASNVDWTDDKVAILKREWLLGTRARAIGEMIGISKNAVLGKAHRLKLGEHNVIKERREIDRSVRKRLREARKPVAVRVDADTRIEALAAPEPSVWPQSLSGDLVSLEQLGYRQCKWPFGDGPFLFCGHPVSDVGKPYCEEHQRLAYRRSNQE